MPGRYLLDTSAIIALFADDTGIKETLSAAEQVFVPSIALGELYYGAHKSSRPTENLARIEQLASQSVVLGCDAETARHYGHIKSSLRAKGRPIPENDIWIAAIASQNALPLMTRDAHFSEVETLQLVSC